MEKVNKYRVVDERHPNFGKKIKAILNDRWQYVDIKTGETYEMDQLTKIPDAHAVYCGIHRKRFGVFLFAREYWRFHSFQLGVSIDAITPKTGDKYLDIECRIACFGVGIRFVIINRERLCKD